MTVHTYGYAEHLRRTLEAQTSVAGEARSPKTTEPGDRRSRLPSVQTDTPRAHRNRTALRELEEAIEELEERVGRIEADLVEASAVRDGDRIAALGTEHAKLQHTLAAKYDAWHEAIAQSSTEGAAT